MSSKYTISTFGPDIGHALKNMTKALVDQDKIGHRSMAPFTRGVNGIRKMLGEASFNSGGYFIVHWDEKGTGRR